MVHLLANTAEETVGMSHVAALVFLYQSDPIIVV